MRTPRITLRRTLGLAVAGALAVTGFVGISAGSGIAASTSIKLLPATGSSTSPTSITVTGRGFLDTTGAQAAKAVRFVSGNACGTDPQAGTAAQGFNVVTATKLQTTTDASLTAGRYMLCIFDGTTAPAKVLGGGGYVTSLPPTATTFAETVTPGTLVRASVLGGTELTLNGTNFTRTTTASINGLKAAVTYLSPVKLRVRLPAHPATTGLRLRVTTAGGSAHSTDTVSYVPTLKVSPISGNGVLGNIVTVTGSGFDSLTFSTQAGVSLVFVSAGQTLSTTASVNTLRLCTDVMVENNTTLSCKAPAFAAAAAGPYSLQLINVVNNRYTTAASTVATAATYTVAAL